VIEADGEESGEHRLGEKECRREESGEHRRGEKEHRRGN